VRAFWQIIASLIYASFPCPHPLPLSQRARGVICKSPVITYSLKSYSLQPIAYSLLFGLFGEFEWGLTNDLFDRAAANAPGADAEGFPRAIGRTYVNALEIRLELPPGNAGHLRANSAEVFSLSAMGHRIAHDRLFSTNLTFLRHGYSPFGGRAVKILNLSV
jgi:hypothetical protein